MIVFILFYKFVHTFQTITPKTSSARNGQTRGLELISPEMIRRHFIFSDLPPAVPVRIGELVSLFNWRDLVLTEGRFNQVTQSIILSGTIASLPSSENLYPNNFNFANLSIFRKCV